MESGTETRTRSRGFASMDAQKQKEIARKGGRAAHEKGTAHEFTSAEARAAGRKGGQQVSANREHMSRIGRIGGKSSAVKRQSNAASAAGAGSEQQQQQPQPVPSMAADRGGEHRMHPGDGQGRSAQDMGHAGSESHGFGRGSDEAREHSHAGQTEAARPMSHHGAEDRREERRDEQRRESESDAVTTPT